MPEANMKLSLAAELSSNIQWFHVYFFVAVVQTRWDMKWYGLLIYSGIRFSSSRISLLFFLISLMLFV